MPEFITYIIIHRYSIVGAILLACFIGYVAYLNLSINNFNVASVKFRSAPLSLPSLALSTPLLLFGLKTKMLSLKPLSLICKLPLLSSVISYPGIVAGLSTMLGCAITVLAQKQPKTRYTTITWRFKIAEKMLIKHKKEETKHFILMCPIFYRLQKINNMHNPSIKRDCFAAPYVKH